MRSTGRFGRSGLARALVAVAGLGAALVVAVPEADAQAPAGTIVHDQAELATAFANGGTARITLAADITVSCAAAGGIGTATRTVGSDVTVDGAGHRLLQTCPDSRLLSFDSPSTGRVTLTLTRLRLSGATNPSAFGAAVYVHGSLRADELTVTGNTSGVYGAVAAFADARVQRSTFRDNRGGALTAYSGAVTVTDSKFARNTGFGLLAPNGPRVVLRRSTFEANAGAVVGHYGVDAYDSTFRNNDKSASGGAISADNEAGVVRVVRSTFAGNRAFNGGAILAGNRIEAADSTFTGNTARHDGGALALMTGNPYVAKARVRLAHVTMTANSSAVGAQISSAHDRYDLASFGSVLDAPNGGVNCTLADATAASAYNLTDDPSCGFGGATNRSDITAFGLGPLAGNGGYTPTRAPRAGSVVVDVIPAAACRPGLTSDQRGVARPQGAGCDAGSVERRRSGSNAPAAARL